MFFSQELRDINPFLTPDWRHEYAAKLADANPPRRSPKAAGKEVQEYRALLLSYKSQSEADTQWLARNPYLYFAVDMHRRRETDYEVPFMLECRILSGEDYASIAKKMKIAPETVTWYSSLFFDVQPYLESTDWIFHQVLMPATDKMLGARLMRQASVNIAATEAGAKGNWFPDIVAPFYDPSVKFFSYLGGPAVCDMMLTGISGRSKPNTLRKIANFMERQYRITLRTRSMQLARTIPVNRYTALEFMKIGTMVQELSKGGPTPPASKTAKQLQSIIGDMVSLASLSVGDSGISADSPDIVDRTDRGRVELDSAELVNANRLGQDVLDELDQFDSVYDRRRLEANKDHD